MEFRLSDLISFEESKNGKRTGTLVARYVSLTEIESGRMWIKLREMFKVSCRSTPISEFNVKRFPEGPFPTCHSYESLLLCDYNRGWAELKGYVYSGDKFDPTKFVENTTQTSSEMKLQKGA